MDDNDKCAIQQKVHQFWFDHKLPTFKEIFQVVKKDENLYYISHTSLGRLLKSMNFRGVEQGCNRIMIEKPKIVVKRRKYIREIRRFREEGRQIYYLGKTKIGAGDVPNRFGCDKPNWKGKLLIVCHLGSEDGFVTDGLLCLESKKKLKAIRIKRVKCMVNVFVNGLKMFYLDSNTMQLLSWTTLFIGPCKRTNTQQKIQRKLILLIGLKVKETL